MSIAVIIRELLEQSTSVRSDYKALFAPLVPTIPIPYFGPIEKADVVTIGLNPSDLELSSDRRWPDRVDANYLKTRLDHYFDGPHAPPHQWFKPWSDALAHLGQSYTSGSAAHIDLCPWATRPMSSFSDQSRFMSLVESSLPIFERCLLGARRARLILVAGAASNKTYLNELLHRSRFERIKFTGDLGRGGRAFVRDGQFATPRGMIPVFFCSVSPSSRSKQLLPERIASDAERLRAILNRIENDPAAAQ